jgi:hypothetical protein
LNWTSGLFVLKPLTFQIFSLSAVRDGLAGPWILSLSIPAGAIAFLLHVRRANRAASLRGEPAPGTEPPPREPG